MSRLPAPAGTLIDRSRPVGFVYNGRRLSGYGGDTLASALLANGETVVARSFKFRRPRGIVASGAEEPNALVQIEAGARSVPNVRATQQALYEGLVARSLRGWPSTRFDFGVLIGLLGRLFPAGFYYKTFFLPQSLWHRVERVIRRVAGLGTAPVAADPDRYDRRNRHCDVLIIGAGLTGLSAAREAAAAGARVIIVDEQERFGGRLWSETAPIDGCSPAQWIERIQRELDEADNVVCLPRSTAFGAYDHKLVAVVERRHDHRAAGKGVRQRLHRIRAREVILASGAVERPMLFANNDRPGVMLASAVLDYLRRYAVAPGERLVLATDNDAAYETALAWVEARRTVVAVLDARPQVGCQAASKLRDHGVDVLPGWRIVAVQGRARVRQVRIQQVSADGQRTGRDTRLLRADLVATSAGWSPVVHLASHTGERPVWDEVRQAFLPGPSGRGFRAAGAARGRWSRAECAEDARRAVAESLSGCGLPGADASAMTGPPDEAPAVAAMPLLGQLALARCPARQFLDQQLDVTVADVELAVREGYRSIELIKRYTGLGFGTDQGKLGNINGMAVAAATTGQSIARTGTTVFRPAYSPVSFGALAGRELGVQFAPIRRTALHSWHEAHGAVWEDVGLWKRPRYYPRAGEGMDTALRRECLAVRTAVGMLDASTLGKIEVAGEDAGEFLDRAYSNLWSNLSPGRCRYGLLLKDDGMIFDDGVGARLDEHRFLMTTTSGNTAAVLRWLECLRQTEWPELDVHLTSVTEHWATIVLAGPLSRAVLNEVAGDVELDAAAFPFMSWRPGVIAGVPGRVFRISYSGELAYEINVPANRALGVWQALYQAGVPHGIMAYGTEAMHVLRAEKGFIMVGQDTDGSRTPQDMQMGWAVSRKKRFSFIGQRSLARSDCTRAGRKQFVGLRTRDPAIRLPEGAQIVASLGQPIPMAMQGHVTSSYFSPILDRSIALAVICDGVSRVGQTVYCPLQDGRTIAAEICSPVFYDPDNARQNIQGDDGAHGVGARIEAPASDGPAPDCPGTLGSPDTVAVQERSGVVALNLQGDESIDAFRDAAAARLGCPLPTARRALSRTSALQVIWLGPGEWLVLLDAGMDCDVGQWRAAMAGAGSVVEVGAGLVRLRLTGPKLPDLLQAISEYDFEAPDFAERCAVSTSCAQHQALYLRRDDQSMDLLVARSFARYIRDWIGDAIDCLDG